MPKFLGYDGAKYLGSRFAKKRKPAIEHGGLESLYGGMFEQRISPESSSSQHDR
jgi:hypothetical protein